MKTRMEILPQKKLIGIRLIMSLANNRTGELWRSFMPRRTLITNAASTDLFSVQVFKNTYTYANPMEEFEKWAAVEVTDLKTIPSGMGTLIIPEGLYAIFPYKGLASEGRTVFDYIFKTWLPSAEYTIDDRPHFELLGKNYKNNDPSSEEEIWIPVKHK